jgi:5-methylcytosine-specific restriction endonuclease McrA
MASRKTRGQREYEERLKDLRWQRKRLAVLERAGWSCEACGRKEEVSLQVHHGYYERDALPWEYPERALYVLCDSCHERAEAARAQVYRELGCIAPWHHKHALALLQELSRTLAEEGEAPLAGGVRVERA